MNTFNFMSPHDIARRLADLARSKRLSLNLSQRSLSERSGVSFAVIKKFERTGKISLESLLKIALVLESLEDFSTLFSSPPHNKTLTLNDLINEKKRKRGRK